ncbi:hypothetical protein EDD86DRAFT_218682 [Gorgonomyces haynaldii]|nr:hypothetical protein EDD86DRAFT_218682 [Gorgonomyces haynaldii]
MEIDTESLGSDVFGSEDLDSAQLVPVESEADIDYSLVYALFTFIATLDGQLNVMKGEPLDLVDDTNSYWWLVKSVKTADVGYVPAENIETPLERLARLNKSRNVDYSTVTPDDKQAPPPKKRKPQKQLTFDQYHEEIYPDDDIELDDETQQYGTLEKSEQKPGGFMRVFQMTLVHDQNPDWHS